MLQSVNTLPFNGTRREWIIEIDQCTKKLRHRCQNRGISLETAKHVVRLIRFDFISEVGSFEVRHRGQRRELSQMPWSFQCELDHCAPRRDWRGPFRSSDIWAGRCHAGPRMVHRIGSEFCRAIRLSLFLLRAPHRYLRIFLETKDCMHERRELRVTFNYDRLAPEEKLRDIRVAHVQQFQSVSVGTVKLLARTEDRCASDVTVFSLYSHDGGVVSREIDEARRMGCGHYLPVASQSWKTIEEITGLSYGTRM